MRLLAAVLTAAAAFLALPAEATTKTVRVPVLHCEVTVEVNDIVLVMQRQRIGVYREGQMAVTTDC
jgi:hypothetical protein